jgi:hypothetical protein
MSVVLSDGAMAESYILAPLALGRGQKLSCLCRISWHTKLIWRVGVGTRPRSMSLLNAVLRTLDSSHDIETMDVVEVLYTLRKHDQLETLGVHQTSLLIYGR